jgi:5'-AMP-activated protein kinase catalytic alpha subunit
MQSKSRSASIQAFLGAPETLIGGPVAKSDVWSCGIILYIILSGHIPIYGTQLKSLKQKISHCTQ